MRILRDIPWTLDPDAFLAETALDPSDELGVEALAFAREFSPRLSPKAAYDEVPVERTEGELVVLGGAEFSSGTLRKNLEKVRRAFPFIVTCGDELEGLDLSSYDYLAFYWLDRIKQAALDQAAEYLRGKLIEETGFSGLSSMNPGSGNVDVWPIEQQRQLFSLLPGVERAIGVRLTDSFLMIPDKTVSGVFFPSEVSYSNCQMCTREACPTRRASYVGTLA